MGLPASQRKILVRIEDSLRGSDPRLAALFSIFTRLTHDEEMPRIEQIRAKGAMVLAWIGVRLVAFGRWFGSPRRARLRTALYFPVAMAIVASAVLVGAGFPSANRCPAARGTVGTALTNTRARICTPMLNPAVLGR
jgi:Protein of unknown function (DUF3040)